MIDQWMKGHVLHASQNRPELKLNPANILNVKRMRERTGKYWANNIEFPLVPEDEDPEDIIALKASEISNLLEPENKWTPSYYSEAMMKPELWVPAMDAEIRRMEE